MSWIDFKACFAEFVADFVAYEALANPTEPPQHIISPQITLNWQVRLLLAWLLV